MGGGGPHVWWRAVVMLVTVAVVACHGASAIRAPYLQNVGPDRATILSAKEFFDTIAYPAVMHCKSGADRAGFVSALYLIVHENRSVDEAMRQLSARFGHFRFSKTGILDAFFDAYRREGEAKGLSFLTWVETIYDPEKLEREFRPGFWSNVLVDRIMRRE